MDTYTSPVPPAVNLDDDGIAAPNITTPEEVQGGGGVANTEGPVPPPEARQDEPPVERRPRGWLESDVKRLLERVRSGEIATPDGGLTPHRVAALLAEVEGLDSKPSTGAVAAIFDRWEKIGAAVFASGPRRFEDFTDAAKAAGIDALKAQARAARADATGSSDDSSPESTNA